MPLRGKITGEDLYAIFIAPRSVTHKELAAKYGISQPHVCNVRNGTVVPRLLTQHMQDLGIKERPTHITMTEHMVNQQRNKRPKRPLRTVATEIARMTAAPATSEPVIAPVQPKTLRATKLTKRQLSILALLARGFINKEIAYKLGITDGTTKAHVSACIDIYSAEGGKAKYPNRQHLSVWYLTLISESDRADVFNDVCNYTKEPTQ